MDNNEELEKANAHIIVEIIEYVSNSVVIKTILKKSTGNISALSFDTGEELHERLTPFDTYAQIIDGFAEIVIDGKIHSLKTGDGIIIPANLSSQILAKQRFKMIRTIIKSGYE